jgi:hypothetical protein
MKIRRCLTEGVQIERREGRPGWGRGYSVIPIWLVVRRMYE